MAYPNPAGSSDDPKLTWIGKLFAVFFIAVCFYGAYYFFVMKPTIAANPKATTGGDFFGGQEVDVGIAYGTEKERWLKWAVEEFSKTRAGKHTKINLIPMGSVEGAHAILASDKRIHVWSPASALYKDLFIQDWTTKDPGAPILREEALALSPMVIVMWEERYQAFIKRYGSVSFSTIAQALQAKGGWEAIAGKPEWGLFKFGHTHPNQSNSGMMTLLLAAYTYHHKTKDLTLKDILDVKFQEWLMGMERAVTGLPNSTGTMMKEMVLKGPSSFDAVIVYENVAIDFLKNAEGRWGSLRVVYPEYNAWNENPFYILNVPWSKKEQRQSSEAFLDFLLTEPIQKASLTHGFRPANPAVPIKFPESPFVAYQKYGIKIDLPKICEPPRAEVINNLLQSWQRNQGNR